LKDVIKRKMEGKKTQGRRRIGMIDELMDGEMKSGGQS